MFQFRRFTSCTYVFSTGYLDMTLGGLPHSDIRGSILICSSPRLFAAYRVLHRLLVPRHSPCALCSLTIHIAAALFVPESYARSLSFAFVAFVPFLPLRRRHPSFDGCFELCVLKTVSFAKIVVYPDEISLICVN